MKSKSNVFINAEDLYQGKTAKIVYNGSLAKASNSDVYLHLGFGMMWENLNEIKMSISHSKQYSTAVCIIY